MGYLLGVAVTVFVLLFAAYKVSGEVNREDVLYAVAVGVFSWAGLGMGVAVYLLLKLPIDWNKKLF